MKDDLLYLLHIRECLDRIRDYTREGREGFSSDTKTQDAVLRNLQTLSESTQHLSADLKATRPDVDWRAIAAFRNVIAHEYLGLDLARTWRVVEHDLPPLREAVEAMLQVPDAAGAPPSGDG